MDEFKQAVSDVQLKKNTPYKNYSYIEHRYFNHPVYEYQFYRVMNREETCSGVFVCREAEHDGVQVCKIIDFMEKMLQFPTVEDCGIGFCRKRHMNLLIFTVTALHINI